MLACILIVAAHGITSAQKLPIIDGKKTVATVNYEPITLQEFNSAIAASHADRPGKKKAGSIVYSGILERIINKRLIVLNSKPIPPGSAEKKWYFSLRSLPAPPAP